MTGSDDQLKQLIRTMDPVPPAYSLPPLKTPLAELLDVVSGYRTEGPRWRPTRSMLVAAAVVAALLVTGGALLATIGGEGGTPKRQAQAITMTRLALPNPGTSLGSCVPFSVDVLADMPVAFAGHAIDVTGTDVRLAVDHWYRGGTAEHVELVAPSGSTISLQGAINFVVGTRYLITATNRTVNYCGYSGEWTAELARNFDLAFGH